MGGLLGTLGLGGGASGTGFAAPTAATLTPGTNQDQLGLAAQGAGGAYQQQQALLNALQGQNGLGNQSQVYNQLQGVASGAINPAQNQLNQNTATNVANQAALMAGQRGASANVGLMARQAAQQGAQTQQQAVGQAATNQATNQINAIGAAGNIANTQAANQIGQANTIASTQQANQANLLNANAQQNANQVNMQSNINSANAGLANTQLQGQQGLVGGLLNGAGAILGKAEGGVVGYDTGGVVAPPLAPQPTDGPLSAFGQFLSSNQNLNPGAQALQKGASAFGQGIAKAFQPAPLGAPSAPLGGVGASDLPDMSMMAAKGGNVGGALKQGGKVPGKPNVPGAVDSYANDTVSAKLSPGEVVIPRHVMMGEDPINESAKFVAAVLAKQRMKA